MSDELAETFGQKLRRLRQARGLTQEELARRAGLTPNAISALERGERRRPYPHTVRALGEALALSAELVAELNAAVPSRTESPFSESPSTDGADKMPVIPLVGREREVDELDQLLRRPGVRLITLTGPGGVGKTSLAMRLVDEFGGRFADGAVFVPLAPLADPALVLPTIAQGLGLREVGGQSVRQQLHGYLGERQMLLALDNLEHLLDSASDIADLLWASNELRILVTSRAPLRLRGEQEYPVRPLRLPALSRVPDVADLDGNPAVELFVERAKSVSPDFALTRQNAAAVAAICRRVDGLPLALELAAARIRTLSPTALLARLDQSLPLLSGGARDLPERQRTMERAIEWSYDLLGAEQQALFRRVSVFDGGWTLDAAEAVGVAGEADGGKVFEHLADLVEQSLVFVEPGEDQRFRLLRPVREYARRRLEVSDEAEETQQRHTAYFTALAEAALPRLKGPEQVAWLTLLEAENDNLRQTMTWLIGRRDFDRAAAFGFSLWLFWWMRGLFSEGLRWMAMIVEPATEATSWARAWALLTAGVLRYGQGDYDRAADAVEASLDLFRLVGDDSGFYTATGMAGLTAISRDDYERGAVLVEEAVRLSQAAGDTWNMTMLRTYSAAIPLSRGDYEHAARLAREGLALAREMGDRIGIYVSLFSLASAARAGGDRAEAARLLREALKLSVEIGDRGNAAYCLEGLASMAAGQGDVVRAARLWGAAEALLESSEAAIYVHTPDRKVHADAVAAARARADAGQWEDDWIAGRALSLSDAVAEADRLAAEIVDTFPTQSAARSHPAGLSEREVEVLRLIAQGLSNAQAAERLYLSPRTVEAHLRRIYEKLGGLSRFEAIRFALDHGLA
jgi:predicted ATPase/DNA-binding CsgD family transcriptional regulator